MKARSFRGMVIFAACLALLTTACASSMTAASSPLTTVVEGEKHLSGTVDLRYDVVAQPGNRRLQLTQTPICREMVTRETVSRKKIHGVLPAIVEIGFFGLGILDLVVADSIIASSETRTPLPAIPTGNTVACATTQPAAHQQVIVQSSETAALQHALTDADGIIQPDLPSPRGKTAYVNVFVRTDTAKRFAGVVWLTATP